MMFESVLEFINRNDSFILTAHETPDGDAIGAEMAVYHALKLLGKNVIILNADPIARKYTFLDRENAFQVMVNEKQLPENLKDWVLLILDTNDINNIGIISREVLPNVKEYFIIDHHESGETLSGGNFIEKEASSTCEILFNLFKNIELKLNYNIAEALYVGIIYDTGCFIYPKTTSETFEIARELVSLGVKPNEIYTYIYESNSISSLKLESKVLSSLELYFNQKVAVQTMTKENILECNAQYEEADTLINIPLKSEQIKVSVFLKENTESVLRCSMRSKGNINVASIAQFFGGGGHKTAAGFKSKFPLKEIKSKLLDKIEEIIK